MKLKFSLILLGLLFLYNPIKSNEQNLEGTCPSSDASCSQKANAKIEEKKNTNDDLEIEDIPSEKPEEKKEEEKEQKKEQKKEQPKIPDVVFKSQRSGKTKENEPEREEIEYPDELQYQKLFQKYGERMKYFNSFVMDKNHTEFYDFNLDDEEIWNLKKDLITIYPAAKFRLNWQGNFLHFYKIVYEKKLPVYLTTDSMLYAFNENLQIFQATFYQEIFPTFLNSFLRNLIDYTTDLIETPEGENHKYFISHTQLYFATALELLNDGSTQKNKYIPAIETQLKSFLKKIKSHKVEEFFMFYNKKTINCANFIPDAYFSRNKMLTNVFRAITWLQINRFVYEKNFVTPIWYIGKMIVDSGNLELFNQIYDSLKFVMGMDSISLNVPEMYLLGVNELGYKDIFELTPDQADKLFRKAIDNKKTLDLPYLTDNFLYTEEDMKAQKVERELSSAVLDYHYDTEDWVKNKLMLYTPNQMRAMMSSLEIPTTIHQTSYFKQYIFAKMRGDINTDKDPKIPLRDGINIRNILERTKYSIKDLMVFSPEKFRTQIKNGIHLLLYKASRRIKSYDPIFNRPFYHEKNFNIAYMGYVDYTREFTIMKSELEMKKNEGGFADVVIEPNVGFYQEMLELTRCYKKMFTNLENFANEKMDLKNNPHLYHLKYSQSKLKGQFRNLEDAIQMLLMVIKKQENGVELDEELKEALFDVVKFDKKLNTWTGWYASIVNPDGGSVSDSMEFHAWTKKVLTARPMEDKEFNGALIYVNTFYPHIGVMIKEDKFTKQRKLLLFSSYYGREAIKLFNLDTLNFKEEEDNIFYRT